MLEKVLNSMLLRASPKRSYAKKGNEVVKAEHFLEFRSKLLKNICDNSLHPDIKDCVFYLEGNHMHSSIQKVPALVLNCEPNIDFSREIEAKRQYAWQVAEFFDFVKKKQETSQEQLPLLMPPHNGGLWMGPEGKHVPGLKLPSLDFRKTVCVRLSLTVLFALKELCQGYHRMSMVVSILVHITAKQIYTKGIF